MTVLAMRSVRVFVSSPGDTHFERMRVERVVERLNGEFSGVAKLEAIRWESKYYQARTTFQQQIPEAADCDLVIAILRHRLGTELPDDFPTMPNGEPYPSGTAYEILSAIEASKQKIRSRRLCVPLQRAADRQARRRGHQSARSASNGTGSRASS